MVVRPVFGAEQCIVTRLGIVGFTTLMGPRTYQTRPKQLSMVATLPR